MKDSDEELKDFFSANPPEAHFDFDPENWEKLSASLKNKNKNRRRLLIYLNLLLLSIGITAMWLLLANGSVKQNTGDLATNKAEPGDVKLVTRQEQPKQHGISAGDANLNQDVVAENFSANPESAIPQEAINTEKRTVPRTATQNKDLAAGEEKPAAGTRSGLAETALVKQGTETKAKTKK